LRLESSYYFRKAINQPSEEMDYKLEKMDGIIGFIELRINNRR